MKYVFAFLLFCISASSISSCNDDKKLKHDPTGNRPSFEEIKGIKYTEVRRAFSSGLSFNRYGFQQVPEWIMYFIAEDSVKVYSPFEKRFIHYPMYYSHDSVFNFARDWFRVKKLTKDSLILQLLEVEAKVISPDKSDVFMTFYSDNYLKKINKNADSLKKPNFSDTLYVKLRSKLVDNQPDSFFAATKPVTLKSINPAIRIEKEPGAEDPINDVSPSDAYMYPAFYIKMDKAYKDFSFGFYATVDANGRIRFKQFIDYVMPEFKESKTNIVKSILKLYLQPQVEVTAGSTLGIPHSTYIKLFITGKKSN